MTQRQKTRAAAPVAQDVAELVRPWQVVCWSLAAAACVALAALTVVGMAAALAWHSLRWSFGQPAQLVVLVLVLLVGVVLHRIDRHASEEGAAP